MAFTWVLNGAERSYEILIYQPHSHVIQHIEVPTFDHYSIVVQQGFVACRVLGPAMPSRELLSAAAEMTEALRCR